MEWAESTYMRALGKEAELFAIPSLRDRYCNNREIHLGSSHMHPGCINMTVPKGGDLWICVHYFLQNADPLHGMTTHAVHSG